MAKIPFAVQLYSIREDCAKDLPATIRQVGAMGYQGVEFAGYYNYSAKDLRRMLDESGMRAAGAHVGIESLLGAELAKSVAFNAALGNRFLIVPGLPENYRNSIEAWKRTADLFNQIAEQLAPHGMFTGYHNHYHEFQPMGGAKPWEVLLARTKARVVMQADTGNALHGGTDVIPYIETHPGRWLTVHLKEFAQGNDKALVGEGDVDWPRFFRACESGGGTEWYIVEQESYPFPPLECVRRCLENLKRMGK